MFSKHSSNPDLETSTEFPFNLKYLISITQDFEDLEFLKKQKLKKIF